MASAFETAVGLAQDTLKTAGPAVTVSIKRGATTVNNKTAVIGNTRTDNLSENGITIQAKVRDYLIDRTAYDLGAGAVEPAEGDEVRETVGGVVQIYKVMPLGGEKAWRWSDPFHKVYRIHTKYTGSA